MTVSRPSGRAFDEMRPVSLERGVMRHAEGSCLVKFGDTHVLCSASVETSVPPWMRNSGKGWVTAEYSMLPRATHTRGRRDVRGPSGRTQEIQRLIGRSLRTVVDLKAMGEKQITVDCDVLQADGGTRTASITGAWIALHDAVAWMVERGLLASSPITDHLAAISCGLYRGEAVTDLDYSEDSEAETDGNFVMTGSGGLVEVQATAEAAPMRREQFDALMTHAEGAVATLVAKQKQALQEDVIA